MVLIFATIGAAIISWLQYHHIGATAFFEFNISNVFTWYIAVVVSYYFVQDKIDKRKSIDVCDDFCTSIFTIVSDERFLKFNDRSDVDFVRVEKEYLSNCIEILSEVKGKFDIKTEVTNMKNAFEGYEQIFDEYFTTVDDLNRHIEFLTKKINLIKKECLNIRKKLYLLKYKKILNFSKNRD